MPSNKKWLGSGHYKLTDRIIKRLWPNFPFYRNKLLIPRNWSNTTSGVIVGGEAPNDLILAPGCHKGSLVFGANDKYISYAGSNDWALGTGDFCIEWWQYQTAASPPLYSRLFQVGDYPNHSIAVSIENGQFIFWVNNGNGYYGPVSLANYLNQWVHFAVVRQSGTTSVYQNGTRIINVSTPNNVTNNTDALKIGFGSGNWWNGKITNFRWVKGSSVYDGTQSTITVPTAPLPAISGTKLLLLTETSGTYLNDSSGLNKSATNNGSVTWSSDAPNFPCCDTLSFVGINANTTGNSAIKTSAGGWDGSAYSTETYTNPVSVTFKTSVSNNYLMGGFSYSPTANTDTYTNTTYGLYIQPGFLEIYENGGQVNVPGSISRLATDVWKVDYDGTNVKYYQNGNLIYTSSNPVTQPLHVFFAFLTGEQGVTDICVQSITP
jgi:hypothetical protein